jgi:hypothetical protein
MTRAARHCGGDEQLVFLDCGESLTSLVVNRQHLHVGLEV